MLTDYRLCYQINELACCGALSVSVKPRHTGRVVGVVLANVVAKECAGRLVLDSLHRMDGDKARLGIKA